MKFAFLLLTLASISTAQPAALNDLQDRAARVLTALHGQAPLSPQDLHARIERSLGLDRIRITDDVGAQLYSPQPGNDRMPAVIVVEPHSDKSRAPQEVLPATLSRLGFFTIVVDTFDDHSRFDQLIAGITPETLIQVHIRSALSYLLNRSDVDPKRIALISDTFAGTIAADLNLELSAIVLTHGVANLNEELAAMRNLGPSALLDSCLIVPGLLNYADPAKLLAALAPRPLLVFASRSAVLEEVREAYRSQRAEGMLSEQDETYGSPEWRMQIYRWLRTHLMNDSSAAVTETDSSANVINGRLPAPSSAQSRDVQRPEHVTQALLDGLFGGQLPGPKRSIVMQVQLSQRVVVSTQPGIEIPMTVLRPGPIGGSPQNGTVIAFSDAGRDSFKDDPFLAEAVRRNWMVWLVDPRGFGELKSAANMFVFAASTLLGENFAWRQAADIGRINEYASGMLPHHVGLYFKGKLANLIAGYALTMVGSRQPAWIASPDGLLTADDLSQLPLSAVPFATEDIFAPSDLFQAMPGMDLFFGELPADFNWR